MAGAGIAGACLYELQELFGEYMESLKDRELTEFEQGQQLAYEQILHSINERIGYVEEMLTDD